MHWLIPYCAVNAYASKYKKKIKYKQPVPFTLWALNIEYTMDANAVWRPYCSSDLDSRTIHRYRTRNSPFWGIDPLLSVWGARDLAKKYTVQRHD